MLPDALSDLRDAAVSRLLSSIPLAVAIVIASAQNAGSSIEPSNVDLAREIHVLAANVSLMTDTLRDLRDSMDERRQADDARDLRRENDACDLVAAIDRMTKAFKESR